VLGLEAASRGATKVLILDRDPRVIAALRAAALKLNAQDVEIENADALSWLGGDPEAFNIVFLDPPFRQNLLGACLERLTNGGWVDPKTWIYIEAERDLTLAPPDGWRIVKSKQAGQVAYYLVRNASGLSPADSWGG
jgi:16S rRNA (guanine966-N2)-methyltransferase